MLHARARPDRLHGHRGRQRRHRGRDPRQDLHPRGLRPGAVHPAQAADPQDRRARATPRTSRPSSPSLGYLPDRARVTGKWDYRTMQAVIAFQAWSGLSRDGVVGPKTLAKLNAAGRPLPLDRTSKGKRVEIYRARGVVLLINSGKRRARDPHLDRHRRRQPGHRHAARASGRSTARRSGPGRSRTRPGCPTPPTGSAAGRCTATPTCRPSPPRTAARGCRCRRPRSSTTSCRSGRRSRSSRVFSHGGIRAAPSPPRDRRRRRRARRARRRRARPAAPVRRALPDRARDLRRTRRSTR